MKNKSVYSLTKRDIAILKRRNICLIDPTDTIQEELLLDSYKASNVRLTDVQNILKEKSCLIKKLELRQNQMNDRKIELLCSAIEGNSTITEIVIQRCSLRSSQLKQICESISRQKGRPIQDLQIKELRINKKGGEAIGKLLTECQNLTRLTLFDTSLDSESLIEICQGLKESKTLEYLDLRKNYVNSDGLTGLINAISEHKSIKHLCLEGIRIEQSDTQVIIEYLSQEDCKIEQLELNEAKIDKASIDAIMEVLYKKKLLKKLSFAKNHLTDLICESLCQTPIRLSNLESLCLSKCDLGGTALENLTSGFRSSHTRVQMLDLSWNNISSSDMITIQEMLAENGSIKKLLIQHNFLGTEGAEIMLKAIQTHDMLTYLDISANEIGSQGFKYFAEILTENYCLHSLHCRKNQIGDIQVLEEIANSLKNNSNLYYLDLQDNDLDDESTAPFLEMMKHNYYIEDIVIGGNPKVSQASNEKLSHECSKNIQIKDFILPHLNKNESKTKKIESLSKSKKHVSSFNLYINEQFKVNELNLSNKRYKRSDFIVKFMDMFKNDLQELSFSKVTFTNSMCELAEYLGKGDSQIQTLSIEDCDIGDTSLSQIIMQCNFITTLTQLRLVRMPIIATHTKEILQFLQKHKNLRILDLSNNNIKCMTEIARLLSLNQCIKVLNLSGNPIGTLEDFRHLLIGLSQNLSVINIIYEIEPKLIPPARSNRFRQNSRIMEEDAEDQNPDKPQELLDPEEHRLLTDQLGMNEYIERIIIPIQEEKKVKGSDTVDMSNQDVGSNIDAVTKYFSVQNDDEGLGFVKKTKLVLNNCSLDEKHIEQLVGGLLKVSKFEIDLLELSQNWINDRSCSMLAGILKANKKLKELHLRKNKNISAEGFKQICKGLRQNNNLEILDMQDCLLDLTNQEDWQEIQDDLSNNCRLIKLELSGNDVPIFLETELHKQLTQNKSIQDLIVPSIIKKKEELRAARRASRKHAKTLVSGLNNISGTGSVVPFTGHVQPQKRVQFANTATTIQDKSAVQTCVASMPFGKQIASIFGVDDEEEDANYKSDAEDFSHGGFKRRVNGRSNTILGPKHTKHSMDGGMDSQLPKGIIIPEKQDEPRKAQTDTESSDNENPFEQAKNFNFDKVQKLSLRGKNLKSLDFLTKFIKANPNVVDIDLGDNPLSANEIDQFAANLKNNKNVRHLGLDGIKHLKQGTKTIIQKEIRKNELIQEIIQKQMNMKSVSQKQMLSLHGHSIKNVGFIHKFLQSYKNLTLLDLTDNILGNRGALEIKTLIQETTTIQVLILRNNRIGPEGLQHICSGLAVNKSIKHVDLRDNLIQDESLKPLLAVLYVNQFITNIRYSVTNEENIERLRTFKEKSDKEQMNHDEIQKYFIEHDHDHHHQHFSCWQKMCLPLWCWRSFIHDKHEAFRFKYDTQSLRIIEEQLMDSMTWALYINNVMFYIIMFICPFIFINPCAQGYNNISHVIYGIYSVWTIFLEVFLVLRIQKRLNNKNLLQFNKWHFVELLFGLIARFDTYLDMCFFNLLHACSEYTLSLPVIFLIVLNITYPFYTLIQLTQTKKTFSHTLPKIERNCRLAFIRENMLLATVLDSFCIDNNVDFCKRPTHQGRIMAVWTLLTQDGPQYAIHLVFLFLVHTDIPHSEFTVLCSLVVSTFAVQISTFNIIMCEPNEFDPILLQLELKQRQQQENQRELENKQEKEKNKILNSLQKPIHFLGQLGHQIEQNITRKISSSVQNSLKKVSSLQNSQKKQSEKKNNEEKTYLELQQETFRTNNDQQDTQNYITNISRN